MKRLRKYLEISEKIRSINRAKKGRKGKLSCQNLLQATFKSLHGFLDQDILLTKSSESYRPISTGLTKAI